MCVYTFPTLGMVLYTCPYMHGVRFPTSAKKNRNRKLKIVDCFTDHGLEKLIAQGHSGGFGPTKTVLLCCANVPASDAPGRSGRSWWSHT